MITIARFLAGLVMLVMNALFGEYVREEAGAYFDAFMGDV